MEAVAVIGGSNGGYAAAADFANQGCSVQWYVRSPDNHTAVLKSQSLTLAVSNRYEGPRRTAGERTTVSLEDVTTDLSQAVSGAEVVVVPLPATAQRGLFEDLAPILEDDQIVLLCPGNFGSFLLRETIDGLAERPTGVTVAETPTLPYVTRRSGDAEVTINLDAVTLPIGAYPGAETERAFEAARQFYDASIPAENAFDCALNDSNPCVNATPTVLNAGVIECDEIGPFNIHRHGIGDGVYNALMAVDEERVRIREELGYGAPHFTQDEYYRSEEAPGGHFYGRNAREALMSADTFSEDPPSLDDRYIHEDVSIATVLLASVGDFLEVETPTIDSIVTIAEQLMDEPYRETGRSLERLGLASLTRGEFEEVLEEGVSA
ncbi:NAD/NADP octopine/nopaline dehydrogenase family protein [Natrinema gelatinilyticum]|uniref:NAD/NADP octopine/nopaline dehydrogenase family protein n=1 Tax=Natrinema gelatinilyticum TaxID=2961571 RepID=UPI0020C560B8|nr:NAD/NADP octopine/nopaline dehydrogenase family protein [Natrinema gelatinilyticum]